MKVFRTTLNKMEVCWFFPLLREVFLRVFQFSPLLKNQHFQIPIRPEIRQTKNHYVDVLHASHYLFILFYLINYYYLRHLKEIKKNYLEQPHMIPFLNEISERKTAFSFKRRKIINFKHEVFARSFNNCFAMNIFIYRDNSYLTGNRGSVQLTQDDKKKVYELKQVSI